VSWEIQHGLVCREPVLLAVSSDAVPDLPPSEGLVTLADVRQLGRNPARIIPALRTFAYSFRGRPVRIVSEFIWPGRSAAETARGTSLSWTRRWRTPPAGAKTLEYLSDLRALPALVASAGQDAGLRAERITDMTIAASEVAANTLRHTTGGGMLTAWHADGEMQCEISDSGCISDPLAGLRRPSLDEPGGQGLWLAKQVCDLVELRSSAAGTTVRLHMSLNRT
jgi:anti-sigma regulatory factor (Ser/Thr protein kinase)